MRNFEYTFTLILEKSDYSIYPKYLTKIRSLALKKCVAMCEENSWQKNCLVSLNICCVIM